MVLTDAQEVWAAEPPSSLQIALSHPHGGQWDDLSLFKWPAAAFGSILLRLHGPPESWSFPSTVALTNLIPYLTEKVSVTTAPPRIKNKNAKLYLS